MLNIVVQFPVETETHCCNKIFNLNDDSFDKVVCFSLNGRLCSNHFSIRLISGNRIFIPSINAWVLLSCWAHICKDFQLWLIVCLNNYVDRIIVDFNGSFRSNENLLKTFFLFNRQSYQTTKQSVLCETRRPTPLPPPHQHCRCT